MDLMMDPVKQGCRETWDGGELLMLPPLFHRLRCPPVVCYAPASPGACGLLPALICVRDAGGHLECWVYSQWVGQLAVCANWGHTFGYGWGSRPGYVNLIVFMGR